MFLSVLVYIHVCTCMETRAHPCVFRTVNSLLESGPFIGSLVREAGWPAALKDSCLSASLALGSHVNITRLTLSNEFRGSNLGA